MRIPSFGWKRMAHAAGALLAVAGLVVVVVQLRRYGASASIGNLARADYIALASLIIVGTGMNACLGLAWRAVLASGKVSVTPRWAVSTYAVTHVARYVPGNVFHYASRQALGMAAGLPARALARASVMELAMVCAGGILLGAYALPTLLPAIDASTWYVVVSVAITGLLFGVERWGGRALAIAAGLYGVYLVMSSVTFLVLVVARGWWPQAGAGTVVAVGGAYVAAWLIGLVTPGAPAGLGVREAVVLYLLHASVDAGILLYAVLATRIVAVCADALACVAGLALRPREEVRA